MKFDIPYLLNDEPIQKNNKLYSKLKYKIEYKVWVRTRLAEIQKWKCAFCQCECVSEPDKKNSATYEHITPQSEGGIVSYENGLMTCYSCNKKRKTVPIEEYYSRIVSCTIKLKDEKAIKFRAG